MEPGMLERVEKLEENLRAMERAMLAMSNTLHVIDAAAFLALSQSPIEVPKDIDLTIPAKISEMMKLIEKHSNSNPNGESNGTSKD